jgi:hypothetical protein
MKAGRYTDLVVGAVVGTGVGAGVARVAADKIEATGGVVVLCPCAAGAFEVGTSATSSVCLRRHASSGAAK